MPAIHHRDAAARARLITVASTNSAWRKGGALVVARIVGIHEGVGAGLDLGIDAARRLMPEGAGAGAADDRAVQAVLRQLLHRAARDASTASAIAAARSSGVAHVLRAAVIGLQPAEDQVLADAAMRSASATAGGPGLDAAARHADIDLDQHRQADAGRLRRLLGQRDLRRVVGAERRPWRCAPARPGAPACAAPTTWLVTSMSGMPPQASASASATFCTHWPTAPRAICSFAITGDLCVLACARSFAPVGASSAAMVSRLCSKASRSITSAGVSISSSRMPGSAGGGCSMVLPSRRPGHDAAMLPSDPDVLVIGAGCAGIAAARALAARGRTCVVLEGGPRVGGRAFTESASLGVPFDHGASWLHQADDNPLTPLARGAGPARCWTTTRCATGGCSPAAASPTPAERAAFAAADDAFWTAIEAAAADGAPDRPAADVAPRGGRWDATVAHWEGAQICAAELHRMSLHDFAATALDGPNLILREGIGGAGRAPGGGPAGAAGRAGGSPALGRARRGRGRQLRHPRARRAAIVTVSTGVLAAGGIAFDPPLPAATQQAIHAPADGPADQDRLPRRRSRRARTCHPSRACAAPCETPGDRPMSCIVAPVRRPAADRLLRRRRRLGDGCDDAARAGSHGTRGGRRHLRRARRRRARPRDGHALGRGPALPRRLHPRRAGRAGCAARARHARWPMAGCASRARPATRASPPPSPAPGSAGRKQRAPCR